VEQLKTYDLILDQVFPRDGRPHQATATFILRFLPSFQPEEEIVITLGPESKASVVTFRAEDSIWRKLGEASRNGGAASPLAIAASVKVERMQLAVAEAAARKWADQLLGAAEAYAKDLRAAPAGNAGNENSIEVDGTLYRMVIETPQSDLTLEFSATGTPTHQNALDDFMGAMERVRREVTALQKQR
jgi:hypothetical protein